MRLSFIALLLLVMTSASAQTEELSLGIKNVKSSGALYGEPTLEIALDDDGKTRLQQFTEKHIGKTVDFFIGENLVLSPYIRTAIVDGVIVLSGSLTQTEIDDMAQRLQAGDRQFRVIAPD